MTTDEIIAAVAAYPRLAEIAAEPFEPRGIFNSEMAAVIALCRTFKVDVVVESGRARGHSTLLLAKHLDPGVAIHTFERERGPDALHAEQKLAGFPNLHLHYGDSRIDIPALIERLGNARVALLIDGPKDKKALDLLSDCLVKSPAVVVAFVHDLPQLAAATPSEGRRWAERYFEHPWFTDDPRYVEHFEFLDAPVREAAQSGAVPWRPYSHGGNESQVSYGPTLGVFLPTPADREAARRRGLSARGPLRIYWRIKEGIRRFSR